MKTSTGIIVALIPDQHYRERRHEVLNPHVTVLHFGTTTAPEFDPKAFKGYWNTLRKVWGHQLKASVTAETAFWCGADDGWAHVDLVNCPFLPEFWSVASESAQLYGLEAGKDYGLLPHITRRYVKGPNSFFELTHRPMNIQFAFTTLALWVGDDHWEESLT